MCGLTGFIDSSRETGAEALAAIVSRMRDRLLHRGPNDSGLWADAAAGVALGFRRLSVVDLSPEGHQPMRSSDGRYVIAFNGEVYNFTSLRQELQAGRAVTFRGHSDTEVMLAAIERWGVEAAVRRFVGMFAFAVWDRRERLLHLVRDRLGEKPLYYGWTGRTFLFGSELKALRAHPSFCGEIDRNALVPYMRHGYIPAPYSVYRGIYKLPPGTILTTDAASPGHLPVPAPYWSPRDVAEAAAADPFPGSDAEAAQRLEQILLEAVRQQMVADVPLGAFLSGGVDSSLIVALMQAQSPRPVKSFTIGFHEAKYNEAQHAKRVARHLGTAHTELYVTPAEALDVVPRIPHLNDEPFGDASQIPTYLLSRMAGRDVTVSLSGDGGDELFGGYSWYLNARGIWNTIRWLPRSLRASGGRALAALSPRGWDRALGLVRPVLPRNLRRHAAGDKVHKLAHLLSRAVDTESTYQNLTAKWNGATPLVLGASERPTALTDRKCWANLPDPIQRLMYLDTVAYLPDNNLAKVDRASMGVSLESRAPLLDHRVVEYAWRLPLSMKFRAGRGKWLLRQILYRYVPRELIDRPKMGFDMPVDSWLRGPLRPWAEDLLDQARLCREGFLDARAVREKWNQHLSGERNWRSHLWHVLMFQTWLQTSGVDARAGAGAGWSARVSSGVSGCES